MPRWYRKKENRAKSEAGTSVEMPAVRTEVTVKSPHTHYSLATLVPLPGETARFRSDHRPDSCARARHPLHRRPTAEAGGFTIHSPFGGRVIPSGVVTRGWLIPQYCAPLRPLRWPLWSLRFSSSPLYFRRRTTALHVMSVQRGGALKCFHPSKGLPQFLGRIFRR